MRRILSRRGQLSIITVTTLALLTVSMVAVIVLYQREIYRSEGAEAKSIAISEVLDSIRSDLKRLLALVMSNASRTYAFHPYYHNLTVFREDALPNVYLWTSLLSTKYDALVHIEFPEHNNITLFGGNYTIQENHMFKLYWYKPVAVSIGYVKATVSIPKAGIYNKTIDAYTGLSMNIEHFENVGNETKIRVRILVDEGYPLSDFRAINMTVLYPDFSYYWRKANIKDYKYLGMGRWEITITPQVQPMGVTSSDPDGVIPLRVYIVDWRGIVASGLTYSGVRLVVRKNTPDVLYYYQGGYQTLDRSIGGTPDEIYTVELDWNFSLHFLLNEAPLNITSPNEKPPPIPPIPVKQFRVYISSDGVSWDLCPFQSEYWKKITWHGHEVWIPVSPANPAYWFNESCRLVFRVPFYTTSERHKYIEITWEADCDADLVNWPTSLIYNYSPPTYKDVISETFMVELIDTEHPQMRGYPWAYNGIAALGYRDANGSAFGPANIHLFGSEPLGGGIWALGVWRPYGTWRVFSKYAGPYSWASLPVRILVILNSTQVMNQATGEVRDDYYDTLAIAYVINGSKYMACLLHIYWESTESDYGAWMFSGMGGGRPEKFMYLRMRATVAGVGVVYNKTEIRDEIEEYSRMPHGSHWEYDDPNFFCTHWGSGIGRALLLSRSAVNALYTIGHQPRFAVTKSGRIGGAWVPQHSLEYEFNRLWHTTTFHTGDYYSYWFVFYQYSAGSGWNEWLKGYKYSPMFLEDYAPTISLEEVDTSW